MMHRDDLSLFLGQLVRHPRAVSAIVPSSPALARTMARAVPPGPGGVAELGPGTGVITRALLARGLHPSDLHLIELNQGFAEALRARHPGVQVHTAGAQDLHRLGLPPLRCVVSGLPLLSFPVPLRHAIAAAAFDAMGPGGRLVQFTYGPQHPLPDTVMADLGLRVRRIARVWGNLPPARVFVYRRRLH